MDSSTNQQNTANMSDLQYIQHFRMDDVMQHLTYALLKHRPVDHQTFTKRWLQHLKYKMEENGTPNSAVGINLLDLDGTVPPPVRATSMSGSTSGPRKLGRSVTHQGELGGAHGGNDDPAASLRGHHDRKHKSRPQPAKALVELIDKMDPQDYPLAYKQLETLVKRREAEREKKAASAASGAMGGHLAAPKVKITAADGGDGGGHGENTKRRIGISATPIAQPQIDRDYKPPVFEKAEEELKKLLDSLSKSTLFSNMDEQRMDIALAMKKIEIGAGEAILRQGHPGTDLLYFTTQGTVDIIKDGKVVASVGSGHYFGEMELMTNVQSCAATVQTATEVEAYVLEKETYQNLVLNFTLANRKKFQALVEKVEFFSALPDYDKLTLAEALSTARYEDTDHIIRCGEASPWMYIVMSGTVTVVGRKDGQKVKIIDLGAGEVVGELEFLFHHDAVADVVASGPVTVAKMSRQHFEMCCGSVDDNLKQFVAKGKYEHYLKNADEKALKEIQEAEKRQAKKAATEEDGMFGFGGLLGFPEFLPDGEILFGSQDKTQVFRFPLLPTQHDKLCLVGVQEDGTILFWNSVMVQLTRFPEPQAVGSSVFSFAATSHDQKMLHELVGTARKWTGNVEGFFAAGEYTRRTIAFANENGISKTLLNCSVIPPTVSQPKQKAEILLLIGHEGKKKAPPPAFDVGDWLLNGLKPKVDGLTREVSAMCSDVEAASMRSSAFTAAGGDSMSKSNTGAVGSNSLLAPDGSSAEQSTSSNRAVVSPTPVSPMLTPELLSLTTKIQAQMKGLEKHIQTFESVVTVDMNTLTQDWQAVSVRRMIGRLQTELSADARARNNKLSVAVKDDVPVKNVYMDVTTLSDTMLYLLKKTNNSVRDREVQLVVKVVEVQEQKKTEKTTRGKKKQDGEGGEMARDFTAAFSSSLMKTPTASPGARGSGRANSSGRSPQENFLGQDQPQSSSFDNALLGSVNGADEVSSNSQNKEQRGSKDGTPLNGGDDRPPSSQEGGASLQTEKSTVTSSAGRNSDNAHKKFIIQYIIRDDGPGLGKDILKNVFDRDPKFGKAAAASTDDPLGGSMNRSVKKPAGLGIRKCLANINRIGGTFEILSSQDGQQKPEFVGTSFVMGFPLLVDESDEGAEGGDGSPLSKGAANQKPFTTVLVESNQIHRSNFCSFLWGRRHAVLPADTWPQVLQLINDGTCDILIVDPEALLDEFTDEDGIPIDPTQILRQHTSKVCVIVTSEAFDPEMCNAKTNNDILALPKPCPTSTMHLVTQRAESAVMKRREEEDRVAGLRETFNKVKRPEVKVGKMLGKGSFGGVYEAKDVITGGKMAMKQLKVTADNRAAMEELSNEIETMTSLQHENIVHYFYCTFTKVNKDGQVIQEGKETNTATGPDASVSQMEDDSKVAVEEKMNVFMELADGGTVAGRVKNHPDGMPLDELVPLLRGTLAGLAYVHGVNMVHCDMKPANVLLDAEGKPKIGDFGTAKQLAPGEKIYTMRGTPGYMAPEVMNADPDDEIGFGLECDIWSLGCIVLEMATGKSPFSNIQSTGGPMGLIKYVSELKDVPDLSPLFKKPPAIFEFVKACLEPDPANRATAKQLLNFSLITGSTNEDGAEEQAAAQKMLARARILHILNRFVAFQDPDSEDLSEAGTDQGRVSKAIKTANSDDFFADSDDEEEEEAEPSPPKRKIVVPKSKGEDDFFADSDDEEEDGGDDDEAGDSGPESPPKKDDDDEDDYRPLIGGFTRGGQGRRGWAVGQAAMSVDLGHQSGEEE